MWVPTIRTRADRACRRWPARRPPGPGSSSVPCDGDRLPSPPRRAVRAAPSRSSRTTPQTDTRGRRSSRGPPRHPPGRWRPEGRSARRAATRKAARASARATARCARRASRRRWHVPRAGETICCCGVVPAKLTMKSDSTFSRTVFGALAACTCRATSDPATAPAPIAAAPRRKVRRSNGRLPVTRELASGWSHVSIRVRRRLSTIRTV